MKCAARRHSKRDLASIGRSITLSPDGPLINDRVGSADRQESVAQWIETEKAYCVVGDLDFNRESVNKTPEARPFALRTTEVPRRQIEDDDRQSLSSRHDVDPTRIGAHREQLSAAQPTDFVPDPCSAGGSRRRSLELGSKLSPEFHGLQTGAHYCAFWSHLCCCSFEPQHDAHSFGHLQWGPGQATLKERNMSAKKSAWYSAQLPNWLESLRGQVPFL